LGRINSSASGNVIYQTEPHTIRTYYYFQLKKLKIAFADELMSGNALKTGCCSAVLFFGSALTFSAVLSKNKDNNKGKE
jgi:hypothetical protein